MINKDRKRGNYKYKYFFCLTASVILPLFAIIKVTIQPSIAQETRVENNLIYVDSQVGNDSNQGDRNTPLKTITQALKVAPQNTTISLAPGIYNEESGEVFPLIIKGSITLKGIAGGQGSNVVIQGGGAFISPTAAEQNVTIAAIKNVEMITGVTVINPHNRGHGVWIESANPQVTHSSFVRNGKAGLSVNGNSNPVITNNYFHRNAGDGLLVYGTSTAIVKDNVFDSTGFGVSVVKNAALLLENNTFKGNRIGVIFEGNSQGILYNNEIFDSGEFGLVAIANSQVNLGDSSQPGNNSFRNNKKLDIQNVTVHTISGTGTEISGQTEGKIDFSDRAIAPVSLANLTNNNTNAINTSSRLRNNPLSDNNQVENTTANNITTESAVATPPSNEQKLPPPPTISNLDDNKLNSNSDASSSETAQEYVFSAPNNQTNSVTYVAPVTPINNSGDSADVNSLSDVLTTFNSPAVRYRVLVEVESDSQKSQVEALYPDVFTTVYQGKPMLQIGAFSDRSLAEKISRSIADLGLSYHILDN